MLLGTAGGAEHQRQVLAHGVVAYRLPARVVAFDGGLPALPCHAHQAQREAGKHRGSQGVGDAVAADAAAQPIAKGLPACGDRMSTQMRAQIRRQLGHRAIALRRVGLQRLEHDGVQVTAQGLAHPPLDARAGRLRGRQ